MDSTSFVKLRFVELMEILPFSMLTVGVIALSFEPWALSWTAASRRICALTGRVIRMELLATSG